jgi:hypothetical protein
MPVAITAAVVGAYAASSTTAFLVAQGIAGAAFFGALAGAVSAATIAAYGERKPTNLP